MIRLKPFFSYYGSKHRIAKMYPRPITDRIVDSFAGSAAYPCAYPHLKVMLYEISARIAGVWDYLIRAPESEVLALPLVTHETIIGELSIPQEARDLISLWCNRGTSHPTNRPAKWMEQYADRMHQCQFWSEAARLRIASQQRHIRHWRIVYGSYDEAPDIRADWFVDPPYDNAAGRRYPSPPIDYSALAAWCKDRQGQVIACENAGASWLPFEPFLTVKGTNGRGRSGISREAIWHRSDLPPAQLALFAA